MPRGAAVPGTARLRGRDHLEQHARHALALHHDLSPARPRAPDRDDANARSSAQVRPAYVKVAEYQQRGLVHLHVLVRLDRAMCKYRAPRAAPAPRRASMPSCSSRRCARPSPTSSAPVAEALGGGRVRWGRMLDVRQLATGKQRGEIAGYLAKYATKSTEQAGGLLHRISPAASPRAKVREHVRTFMSSAFVLDADRQRRTHQPRRAASRPATSKPTGTPPRSPSALRRAMTTDEPAAAAPARRQRAHRPHRAPVRRRARAETGPVAVELDTGTCVHLADVVAIGPAVAKRPAPRPSRSAAGASARTPSATAATA